MTSVSQTIPVRIYDREQQIILAAPLPGLEAEDISVTVAGNKITIMGEERGPGQHGPDLIVDEWTIGPYYSEISLPGDVEGSLTNATYGNGVLILAMPKCDQGVSPSKAHFQLHPIASTRGERIAYTGKDIHASSNLEHNRKHQSEK
jgi:HSP20 family protein